MARFVVLTHDWPALHWDLMFEREGTLRTWRLPSAPDLPGAILAEAISDHRLEYLDYEGPVSGNRGHVRRWDAGTYRLIAQSPKRFETEVAGSLLRGAVLLTNDQADRWSFEFVPSEPTGLPTHTA